MPDKIMSYGVKAPTSSSNLSLAAVALGVVGASVAGGFEIWASDSHSVGGFTFWAITPFALFIVSSIFMRRNRSAATIMLVASALAVALQGVEIYDFMTSTSSTEGLTFLVTPVMQIALGIVAIILALILKGVRQLSPRRST